MHLIPPEVEPPQPPISIKPKMTAHAEAGQMAKLAVANPVVVAMETT